VGWRLGRVQSYRKGKDVDINGTILPLSRSGAIRTHVEGGAGGPLTR
jgi:hypothetical protein